MTYWHNGKWVDSDQITLSVSDRGLMLSDGIFDTMSAYNGKIFMGEEHIDRLFRHANSIFIVPPYSRDALLDIANQLIDKNNAHQGHYAIRTTMTRGAGMRGLNLPDDPKPTVIMRGFSVAENAFDTPFSLMVSKTARRNGASLTSKIKALNYLDSIIAKEEARQNGFDDALMLNNFDQVVCCSSGNIFFITKDGTLITPPLNDGVMDGTTRDFILNACEELNIPHAEKSILQDDLKEFDAVFVTNIVFTLRVVEKIDAHHLNIQNPVFETLKAHYLKALKSS